MRLPYGAGALALLLFGAYGAWSLADSRTRQLAGELIHRVETDRPVVALTFDDGPTPEGADSILAILAEHRVRATFFFTGAELAKYPGLVERFVAAGHELGNHSYSHRRFLLKSPGYVRREVESTDSILRQAGYAGPIHFRPPYGKKLIALPWYLSRTGRTTVMWDVEPDSYPEIGSDAARVVDHVRERARPGSIIILHVMYPSRRESLRAVPGVIQALREVGLEFVTVSELMQH